MASWTKSQLPRPTNDLDKVANDIDRWGYGLLEDALNEPLLTKTRARLLDQAAAELQFGVAFEDGGPSQKWGDFRDPDGRVRSKVFTSANGGINQRVWLLPNKGEEFLAVLEINEMHEIVSHVLGEDKDIETIAAEGNSGTALITDGRIWHGTGANVTKENRIAMLLTFCGPQYRPQVNYPVALDSVILKSASDRQKALFGLKIWWGYGRTGNPNLNFINPDEQTLGKLTLS